MANREELAIIRNARAGQVAAQLELGKLYLFGSAGLPQSLPTALHWLERAARQDCSPAWQLIGNHIPLELAQRNPAAVAQWYERAYDDGSVHAGLVYAQLMLKPAVAIEQQYPKAVRALEDAARAGFPHAQWLLSQHGSRAAARHGANTSSARAPASAAGMPGAATPGAATPVPASHGTVRLPIPGAQCRMAGQDARAAQSAQLDQLWEARQWDGYLERALPLARALVAERSGDADMRRLAPDEITLLSRCARLLDPALDGVGDPGSPSGAESSALAWRLVPGEPGVLWEIAAAEHDRYAQLALGLRYARMRIDGRRDGRRGVQRDGQRIVNGGGEPTGGAHGVSEHPANAYVANAHVANAHVADAHVAHAQVAHAHVAHAHVANAHVANAHVANAHVANFKKAVRWLTLAGEQGLAEAWYALSRIYIKPEFSQRNVADAQRYLEHAADMGYREAQLECGHNAWRARRENENNDVRAVYWLQKAAAQGSGEAAELLHKIAPRLDGAPYLETGRLLASHAGALAAHPLLAARVELASLFNLSRAEALLLDVGAADQGHCLVIDIRASYGRSKRRLVMVESRREREALDRIVLLFAQVDCGPVGPEGNYRQRLYRLRTLLNVGLSSHDDAGRAEVELAA